MLWRTAGLAGAIMTCVAAVPAVAAASTVTTRIDSDNPNFGRIVYSAAPGELNRLTVTEVDDQTLRVVDTGAVIVPSGGCQAVDAHTAQCTTKGMPNEPGLIRANVWAGDLNDVVRTDGPGLAGSGGPGDDTLEGDSIVANRLNGGGGRDTLIGGSNDDFLTDGDSTGAVDSDRLEGRGGADTVNYESRTIPVRVSLPDTATAGEAGENDVLVSISRARGGAGDDDLRGSPGRNSLDGNGGDDRLFARGGEDFLDGGAGDDDVRGGPGGDFLTAGLGADEIRGGRGNDISFVEREGADEVSCGRGFDSVVDPSRRDLARSDCEEVVFNYGTRQMSADAFPHRRTGGSATFDLHCPSDENLDGESIAIAGRMFLRRATDERPLLGRATIPKGPGRDCGDELNEPRRVRVKIELNARGRRLASRPDGVLTVVGMTGFHLPDARWTIRLKV